MKGVDGTRGTTTPGETARTQKEPEQGAFDRVLDRRGSDGEGGAGASAPGGGQSGGQSQTVTARPVQARGEGGEGSGGQGEQGHGDAAPAVAQLLVPKPSSRSLGAGSVQLGGLGNATPVTLGATMSVAAARTAGAATPLAPGVATHLEPSAHNQAAGSAGGGQAEREARRNESAGDEAAGAAAAAVAGLSGGVVGRAVVPADIVVAPAVDANAVRALAEKVAVAMELHLVGQRPEVAIGLDLGTLGAGSVTIQRGAEGVSIAFQLATDQSTSFLAERLPQLEQALADRGITVARLEAATQGAEPRLASGEHGARDQGGQERRRGQDHGQGDGRSRGRIEAVLPEEEG